MKVCKVCGTGYEEKPRFCPKCGSYFIDANDPNAEVMWKGVIREGTLAAEDAITYVQPLTERQQKDKELRKRDKGKSTLVWSILGLVFSSILLTINILAFFSEMEVVILGFPHFIMSIVALKRGDGKMQKVALFMFLGAILLFVIGIFKGAFFS